MAGLDFETLILLIHLPKGFGDQCITLLKQAYDTPTHSTPDQPPQGLAGHQLASGLSGKYVVFIPGITPFASISLK